MISVIIAGEDQYLIALPNSIVLKCFSFDFSSKYDASLWQNTLFFPNLFLSLPLLDPVQFRFDRPSVSLRGERPVIGADNVVDVGGVLPVETHSNLLIKKLRKKTETTNFFKEFSHHFQI